VKKNLVLGALLATSVLPVVGSFSPVMAYEAPPPAVCDLPILFDRDLHIAIDRKQKTLWVSQSYADGEGGTYEHTYASYPVNPGKPGYETPSSENEPGGVFKAFDIRDFGQEAEDYGSVKSSWRQLGTGKVIRYGDPRFPLYSGIIAFAKTPHGEAAIHDISTGELNFAGESAGQGSHACPRLRRSDFRDTLGCAMKVAQSGYDVLVKVQ
jgi:hypothetical protein